VGGSHEPLKKKKGNPDGGINIFLRNFWMIFNGMHGVISHKKERFIGPAVRTSNPMIQFLTSRGTITLSETQFHHISLVKYYDLLFEKEREIKIWNSNYRLADYLNMSYKYFHVIRV
jgi:hypothetical protein